MALEQGAQHACSSTRLHPSGTTIAGCFAIDVQKARQRYDFFLKYARIFYIKKYKTAFWNIKSSN
jgi:hypothetical protein